MKLILSTNVSKQQHVSYPTALLFRHSRVFVTVTQDYRQSDTTQLCTMLVPKGLYDDIFDAAFQSMSDSGEL
ncbi:hypothetical protein J6590_038127 [Homalodisca vitripennis]|nr:hypothetical protein J6590_038127 [Homalodisca vitripennis]